MRNIIPDGTPVEIVTQSGKFCCWIPASRLEGFLRRQPHLRAGRALPKQQTP